MKQIQYGKVVGNSTREPINMQAALVMRKCPEWARPGESFEVTENRRLRIENNTMKEELKNGRELVASLQAICRKKHDKVLKIQAEFKQRISEWERTLKTYKGPDLEEKQKILKKMKAFDALTSYD